MSYDLMVFNPDAAPRFHSEFIGWYDQQTEWSEDHGYDDPSVSTPALQAWFADIVRAFPPMNGPLAVAEPDDEESLTDYSVGKDVIYAAFAWSKAQEAYATMFALAEKHELGFFNVSSDNADVWLPKSGRLVLAPRQNGR